MTAIDFHERATEAAFDTQSYLVEQAKGDPGIVLGASLHLAVLVMADLIHSGELAAETVDVALAGIKATVEELVAEPAPGLMH